MKILIHNEWTDIKHSQKAAIFTATGKDNIKGLCFINVTFFGDRTITEYNPGDIKFECKTFYFHKKSIIRSFTKEKLSITDNYLKYRANFVGWPYSSKILNFTSDQKEKDCVLYAYSYEKCNKLLPPHHNRLKQLIDYFSNNTITTQNIENDFIAQLSDIVTGKNFSPVKVAKRTAYKWHMKEKNKKEAEEKKIEAEKLRQMESIRQGMEQPQLETTKSKIVEPIVVEKKKIEPLKFY